LVRLTRTSAWRCGEHDGQALTRAAAGVLDDLADRLRAGMLAPERREFDPDYHDHGWLFCWENGKPPHPDTITRRFKRLAMSAGLPEIDLHDVRHSYATAGRDAKIDWKALSERIGHSDVAFTMKQYVQTDLEADRQVANTLAELIVGGLLVSPAASAMPQPELRDGPAGHFGPTS